MYRQRFESASLGYPMALLDSERLLSELRAEGYTICDDYSDENLVVVNICGFIQSVAEESLDAIAETLDENGRVIVTGTTGHDLLSQTIWRHLQ